MIGRLSSAPGIFFLLLLVEVHCGRFSAGLRHLQGRRDFYVERRSRGRGTGGCGAGLVGKCAGGEAKGLAGGLAAAAADEARAPDTVPSAVLAEVGVRLVLLAPDSAVVVPPAAADVAPLVLCVLCGLC